MEFTGTIKVITTPRSGVSKQGKAWKSVEIVVEDHDQYPHKGLFKLFGEEKVDSFLANNKLGDEVKVSFDLKASEWNEKWMNSLDVWKIELLSSVDATYQPQPLPQQQAQANPNSNVANGAQQYGGRPNPGGNFASPAYGQQPQQQVNIQPNDTLPF